MGATVTMEHVPVKPGGHGPAPVLLARAWPELPVAPGAGTKQGNEQEWGGASSPTTGRWQPREQEQTMGKG